MNDGGNELKTLGAVAVLLGVGHWSLDRLARRQQIPVVRAGRLRLIRSADVEKVREACVAAGYLKGEKELAAV